MRNSIVIYLLFVFFFGCQDEVKNHEQKPDFPSFVNLPADLTHVPDSTFLIIDDWLRETEIIGLTEAEHGMNEALDFRNSYIKFMVRTNRIQVLAFESGLLESRMVNEYIHGKNLDVDSVLTNGFTFTFGQFEQNRELIHWLRKTNESRESNKQVSFYGFDLAGNASNPYLDDASFALQTCLTYLQSVDPEFFDAVFSEAEFYFPYLNIPESTDSKEKSYLDLSAAKKLNLNQLIDRLEKKITAKRDVYVKIKGLENYEWALKSVVCARQNVVFLEGFLSAIKDQSSREKFMLENLKWIKEREGDKRILLFAHLAHLAKDISRIDENGMETMPDNMFGELLEKKFGAKYKVIGNFFKSLDYYTEIDSVQVNSFTDVLDKKASTPNFCLKMDLRDSIFLKQQAFGVPFRGHLWMTPAKGVDVIFYTETQHYFYKE